MKVSAVERRRGAERRRSNRRGEATDQYPPVTKLVLTTREVAEILKVTQQTIKTYIYKGKIKSHKTPGGRHRIFRSDLIKSGYIKSK